jgi:hypothetical protein
MPLTFFHNRLAITVSLYFGAMGIWSLWRFFRKTGFDSNYRGAVVISEIIMLFQGGLGGLLWLNALRPGHGSMHVLYGIIGLGGLPFIYSITKGRENRYEMLLYGAMYFCLLGIIWRLFATG